MTQASDGELWLGDKQFAATLSIVSKQQPVDSERQHVEQRNPVI